MSKYPLISIITPLFNTEKYISKTIESVINQTYQNWELIIIDDKSADKSKDIVRNFLDDKRINLIGRVSMDLITVDLTNFINLKKIANKEFELIGNKNSINTISESINTIPYEILTNLGKRYQRRYIS